VRGRLNMPTKKANILIRELENIKFEDVKKGQIVELLDYQTVKKYIEMFYETEKDRKKKPRISEVMTEGDVEALYEHEFAKWEICTETTPHYDSFSEYLDMIIDSGVKIIDEPDMEED